MLTRSDFPAALPQSALVLAPPAAWKEIATALLEDMHLTDRWQLAEDAKRLAVADIKALHHFALQTPRGSAKLAILTDATAWSPQVANALLKLLEEPPAYLTLVVLSESDQLLPTVRSRLVALPLPPTYATLEARSEQISDREAWRRFLGRCDLRQPAGRTLAQEALYLQAASHSGHRVPFILESLSESL